MNCTVCNQPLPEGVAFCPSCGAPVENQSSSGQIDPTVLSAPPPLGTDPYAPPPPNPYTQPPPNPYGATSYGPNPYGAPAAGGATPSQPAGYPAQPEIQPPPFAPAPKRRSRLGLILAIVAIVLILSCGGIFFALYQVGKNALSTDATATAQANANAIATAQANTNANANATATAQANTNDNATATATAANTSTSPSGAAIDPAAAAIITHPQMASSIDSNYNPTKLANTFAVNQNIYITYNLSLNGQTGYIEAKWYVNNVFGASKIFNANDPTFTHGYFAETYKAAANGAIELYWCTKSDCSDAALAQFSIFTVS